MNRLEAAPSSGSVVHLLQPTMVIITAIAAMAVAAWLYPASVHIVAWPRGGLHRVAVLAPLVKLFAITGATLVLTVIAIVGLRSRGYNLVRLAYVLSPLQLFWLWTVPYWPWLPDRWPLLLAGAGPLRWVVAAVSIAAVVMRLAWRSSREPSATRQQASAARDSGRRWPGRRTAFAAAVLLYAIGAASSVRTTGLGGDEPHYLIITHSLLADGDLKIENNHARGDYRSFFGGELRPDYLQRGQRGDIYSIHAPGLALLLLPGYAFAGLWGAVFTMCLVSALASLAIFDIAVAMAGRSVAWLVWATTCLTVPVVPHAWALYPEMVGAAIVAWAVAWLVTPSTVSVWAWGGRGVLLAWLPWLHTKFSVLLAGVALWLVWRLRKDRAAVAALLVPLVISGVAWLLFFFAIYGRFDPQAPYGGYAAQFVRFENVPRSVMGLLVDQKFGLLAYAPIYALACFGLWRSRTDRRWGYVVAGTALVAGAYTISSGRLYMWWAGSSAPARFLVPIVPLLAPALARGCADVRSHAARAAWVTAGCLSISIGLAGTVAGERLLLFSDPHGVARILDVVQGSAPLTAALPTFTEEDWRTPLARLGPWLVAVPLALGAGRWCARLLSSGFWIGTVQVVVLVFTVSGIATSFPASVRADVQARGDLELMHRFDPVRLRAFDYAAMARLTPPDWLALLSTAVDRQPGTEPDPLGRVMGPVALPPGTFEARVWFEGAQPRAGAVQIAIGGDRILTRIDGPLSNPAVLRFTMPVAIPALWAQLTDLASARSVRRVELAALDVTPAAQRRRDQVIHVEGLSDSLGAYVAYTDANAYPEGGVFWTRADGRARLLLVPAGARVLSLIVHVGPKATPVSLRVGEWAEQTPFAAEETRTITIPLPPKAVVPLEVQAGSFFRPVEVDVRSNDSRALGAQVRLVLE